MLAPSAPRSSCPPDTKSWRRHWSAPLFKIKLRQCVQTLPDGLETQFTPPDTTQTALSCFTGGRCELGISLTLYTPESGWKRKQRQSSTGHLSDEHRELAYIRYGIIGGVFTARCYASAVLAMGLCVSVCPSHVGVLSKRLNESSWFLAPELPSTRPTLC